MIQYKNILNSLYQYDLRKNIIAYVGKKSLNLNAIIVIVKYITTCEAKLKTLVLGMHFPKLVNMPQ
jgi:hypothetical protein